MSVNKFKQIHSATLFSITNLIVFPKRKNSTLFRFSLSDLFAFSDLVSHQHEVLRRYHPGGPIAAGSNHKTLKTRQITTTNTTRIFSASACSGYRRTPISAAAASRVFVWLQTWTFTLSAAVPLCCGSHRNHRYSELWRHQFARKTAPSEVNRLLRTPKRWTG